MVDFSTNKFLSVEKSTFPSLKIEVIPKIINAEKIKFPIIENRRFLYSAFLTNKEIF